MGDKGPPAPSFLTFPSCWLFSLISIACYAWVLCTAHKVVATRTHAVPPKIWFCSLTFIPPRMFTAMCKVSELGFYLFSLWFSLFSLRFYFDELFSIGFRLSFGLKGRTCRQVWRRKKEEEEKLRKKRTKQKDWKKRRESPGGAINAGERENKEGEWIYSRGSERYNWLSSTEGK